MELVRFNIHKWVYFFGLSIIAIGLPVSEFLMSVGQFIIFGNWLFEGQLAEKLKRFWNNKLALLVSSVILIHLLGLIYTSDFEYAFKDIRIKAPLFVLPLIIATSTSLSKQVFNWLMAIFVATVAVGTFISMGVYYGVIHTKAPVVDIRDISIFISHIRFSLLVCLSIFILGWYVRSECMLIKKVGMNLLIVWLVFFLIFLDSLTGIVAFILVTLVQLFHTGFTSEQKKIRLASLSVIFLSIVGLIVYVGPLIKINNANHSTNISKLESTTSLGNPYLHDSISTQMENGYPLWIYICWRELEPGWAARSTIDFNGNDKRGDRLRFTLLRYMTSKGLRKDAAGFNSLSMEDIHSIENGVPNVYYVGKSALTIRILETLWEFNDFNMGSNINGHSAAMRMEFWKAGWGIIKKNSLIGVGTGDIKNAYAEQYNAMKSPLDKFHRLRSHNQYLSIAIAFGILGLIWFIIALVYPFIHNKLWSDYLYFSFVLIALLSFLNEDTLETQPGVTFFAFFNTLFLFGRNRE